MTVRCFREPRFWSCASHFLAEAIQSQYKQKQCRAHVNESAHSESAYTLVRLRKTNGVMLSKPKIARQRTAEQRKANADAKRIKYYKSVACAKRCSPLQIPISVSFVAGGTRWRPCSGAERRSTTRSCCSIAEEGEVDTGLSLPYCDELRSSTACRAEAERAEARRTRRDRSVLHHAI